MVEIVIFVLSALGTSLFYVFKLLTFSNAATYFIPLGIFLGLFVLCEGLYISYLWFTSLFLSTKKEYNHVSKYYKHILDTCLKWMVRWGRVKLVITNKELVPTDSNYMIVCNHRSNFDPIIIGSRFTHPHIAFISKESNFNIPIAGKHINRDLFMSIDRENPKNAMKTINRAAKLMREEKISICVFPEGTRNKGDGLLEFKPGCFKIAVKAEAPIVVATLHNTEFIHKNAPFKKTLVNLDIVKVYSYDEIKDVPTQVLSSDIYEEMLSNLSKY